MRPTLRTTLGTLLLAVATAHATLDIVPMGDDPSVLVLKNTDTGKVLGTFWDRNDESSDYGFESSIMPDFQWSGDRGYVAVTAGASRNRAVSLYRVTAKSLEAIEVPLLSSEQAAEIDAIDAAASGTDAVRWQPDGTLLLRFWAQGEVQSGNEEPKTAELWADLEVSGDTAKIVGTSTMEPSSPSAGQFPNPAPPAGETLASQQAAEVVAEEMVSPATLEGVHRVTGQNPDGSSYEGAAEIRVVNGVVGVEWKIGKTVSHGQGLMIGMTLGLALDDGLAIYRLFGQSEGQSLIGVWSSAGSEKTNGEAILIGNPDMTQAEIEPVAINGSYVSVRQSEDGPIKSKVVISGGDLVKSVRWTDSAGETTTCQALALGEAIAVLTPTGLSVLSKHIDDSGGVSLVGRALNHDGSTFSETLTAQP